MDFFNAKTLLLDNATVKQTILKNTFWLSLGTITNKLFSLFLIIFAARVLGAEGYGQFTFALAFASLFTVLSHLGLPNIITREFAREENKNDFYAIASLQIVLVSLTFLLIAAASFLTISSLEVRLLILILGIFLLMNSLIGTAYSYFHSQQKMEYEAWLEILQMGLLISFGLFILFQFPSPLNLSYAYAISATIAFLVALALFHAKMFRLRLRWNVAIWKKYLGMSWPLALSALFAMLYSYIDSIMLGYWGLFVETGWYNAAQRVMVASLLPMGFVSASFLPALSRLSQESKNRFQSVWSQEVELMITLSLPLAVGGIVLASGIVSLLYSTEFVPAVLALQILLVTAAINFLFRPFYHAMVVLNQQQKIFWITMAGVVLNIVLNLILIPQYSLYGAATATLGTYSVLLLIAMIFVKKFTFARFSLGRISLTTAVSVFSVYIMYMSLRYLQLNHIHVVLLIFIGAIVYGVVFFGLRKFVIGKYFKQFYV